MFQIHNKMLNPLRSNTAKVAVKSFYTFLEMLSKKTIKMRSELVTLTTSRTFIFSFVTISDC